MSSEDRRRWDEKYATKSVPDRLVPDEWLQEQIVGLTPGRALELACGLGHNAIWLAQQGWQVDAVDVSPVGLEIATGLARRLDARINWIPADLDELVPEPAAYDLVCVFRFLNRSRLPRLIEQSLRPGGCLIYETFTAAHLARPDSHMKN